MRRSREKELLWFLSLRADGFTASELIGEHPIISKEQGTITRETVHWPKKTVFRHLKTLIKKDWVTKSPVPRKNGIRGRPATRYQLNPNRKLVLKYPAKRIGRVWFVGKKITRSTWRKPHVRLYGKTKKDYEEYKAWLKEQTTIEPGSR